jgi:cell shape-determining protein MreC
VVLFDKLKQDATKVLTVFLVMHLLAVSFNRAQNRPGFYVGQVVLMTLYWPVQYVAAHGLGSFRNAWNYYFTLRDARAENEQLRRQLAQANQKLLEAEDKAKVAEQLDTLVKWRSGLNYPAIDAQVIARDATQWFNTS